MPAQSAPTVASADASWLQDVLVRHYALTPIEVARLAEGTQTDNFTVTVDGTGRRYFAKVRRPGYPAHAHLVLELEQQASESRIARLPAAQVVPDREGRLLVPVRDRAISLHEFVDGAVSRRPWTPDQAAELGAVLGRLHRWLARRRAVELPVPDLWWAKPPGGALDGVRRVVDAITARQRAGRAGEQDALRLEQVERRGEDIERHHAWLAEGLPPVVRQIVHGDYVRPNLLMRGNDVAAVLDPMMRYLPAAWELGRVAFDPATVAQSLPGEWMASAVALVAAYRDAYPELAAEQVRGCARMALLHGLLSTYGVFEHYLDPQPLVQDALDLYWDQRVQTVRAMLDHLGEVEAELAGVAARRHRTWGR